MAYIGCALLQPPPTAPIARRTNPSREDGKQDSTNKSIEKRKHIIPEITVAGFPGLIRGVD